MIYCEASFIVAVLAPEVHSAEARAWLRTYRNESLAISRWVSVEVASALAMKERRQVITSDHRRRLWTGWSVQAKESFRTLPIDDRHFDLASTLVDSGRAGLRGADSLHLAIVLDHGCALATFDHDLADASRAHGVDVHGLRARH